MAKQPVCACRGKYPVGVCGLFFVIIGDFAVEKRWVIFVNSYVIIIENIV